MEDRGCRPRRGTEARNDERGVPRAGLDPDPHRPREIDCRPATDHGVIIRLCTEKNNISRASGRGEVLTRTSPAGSLDPPEPSPSERKHSQARGAGRSRGTMHARTETRGG